MDNQGKAFKQRRQQQHIVLAHLLQDLGMRQAGNPAVPLQGGVEGNTVGGGGASDQGEVHLAAQCSHRVEGIGQTLALAEGTHIEHAQRALTGRVGHASQRRWSAEWHHVDGG